MGDPMRPLLWVSKSRAKLAAALRAMGHKISAGSIPKLLGLLKYSRQVNRLPPPKRLRAGRQDAGRQPQSRS
jgi:hypothetical protein